MWRQSLAEKKGVSPSEALFPDRTLSVEPCASSTSALFRLGDVSAVDCEAGSGDEARFFRGQVGDEASDLRYITHALQRNQRLDQLGMCRAHVRRCGSGLNVVYRDGARGQIDGSAPNKPCKRSLGHAVNTCAREGSANSGVAADEHDPASFVHLLGSRLNTHE